MRKWLLALTIGWYLLVPPLEKNDKGEMESKLYYWLAKWDQAGAYDTASDCSAALERRIKSLERVMATATTEKAKKSAADMYWNTAAYAKCVATDDPNLRRPS